MEFGVPSSPKTSSRSAKGLAKAVEGSGCSKVYHCRWCRMAFQKQQSMAVHTRFCSKRKEQMPKGNSTNQKPAALARNFNLNELPLEACLPKDILRLTYD